MATWKSGMRIRWMPGTIPPVCRWVIFTRILRKPLASSGIVVFMRVTFFPPFRCFLYISVPVVYPTLAASPEPSRANFRKP